MRIKTTVAVSVMALLAACGGGSSGISNFQTLSILPNGDGVARATTNNGEQALVYSPYVVDFVAGANAANSNDVANVTASDFPITSQMGFVRRRSGTMSSGGTTFNVRTVEDTRTSDAAIVFVEMPVGENDIIVVAGTAYSNAPVGSFAYFGTQVTTESNGLAPGSIGSFTLNADFSQETFQYAGTSGAVSVSGTGVLDVTNGRFATSNLRVIGSGRTFGGTLHGLLHGAGATATSGVFHASGSVPAYTGAFVGSR